MKGKPAKHILSALAGAALLLGCTRTEPESVGAASLTARIAEEVPETRTSYDGYEGKFLWNEGDEIAVHLADGTAAGRYETFKVLPDSPAETGSVAISTTSAMTRDGYAVYPASAAVAASYGSPTLKVTLPAEYDISDIVSGASSIKTSDFSPCPMVAINDPASAPDELDFHHVGGLLRITLKGVEATTQKVRVTFDEYATGIFAVATPSAIPGASVEGPKITVPDEGGRGKVVTFTLAESSLGETLAAGNIVLNVPVPCVTFNSVTVETLNAAGTVEKSKTFDEKPRVFNRHHGKKLAFGLAFDFVLGTLPDAATEGLSDVTVAYTGGDGSFATSFVSYKTSDGGATKTAVPFTLEYSEDEGATWSTTKPSWLSSAPAGGVHAGGSTGESMAVTVLRQVPPDPHHDELCKTSRAKTDFDLSLVDVSTFNWTGGTPGTVRRTANCYVVQGSGTYTFPLVYGNGGDWTKNPDTGVNEDAYRAKTGVDATGYRPDDGETDFLGRFKDHLDNNITSPYIATQQSGKAMSAVLVWQDAPGLVTVDPVISGSGENAYIHFTVPAATITQGNALIAVLVDDDNDGTPETVAWSWHVWVTEEDLTAVKEGSNSNYLAPVDIGWCEGKTETYAARTCQVRATQAGSGLARTATLTQTEGGVVTGGNSPYYQWGRKDPLQASNGKGNTFKTYYPSESAYAPAFVLGPVSIGAAIRSPYTFYMKRSSPYDWCNTTYHNHWSSTINGSGPAYIPNADSKTKTVYDPSPVGFRVPALDAWDGFNTSNFTWGAVGGDNGRTYTPSGLFFPASGIRDVRYGGVEYVGSGSNRWSSSPDSATYACNLSFTLGDVYPSGRYNARAYGFPVRCVKE